MAHTRQSGLRLEAKVLKTFKLFPLRLTAVGWRVHTGDNLEANRKSLKSTPTQMLTPGGSICGRLTSDLPLGCLQGGWARNLLGGQVEAEVDQKLFQLRLVHLQSPFISDKVFVKSFCRSQLPHKSVNLSFTVTNMKHKLTKLCGDCKLPHV